MTNKKFLYLALVGFAIFIIIILVIVFNNVKTRNQNKEITLTFWNLDDDESAFAKVITDFQAAHSNVKIVYTKKDANGYLDNVLQELAAGKGPDILAVPHDWLPKYHNLLTPLPAGKMADPATKKSDTDVYTSTFANVAAQDNIIDQKIYGIPLTVDTLQLYYNPTIVDDALNVYRQSHEDVNSTLSKIANNGPKNWDEFQKLVQIITQKSGTDITLSAAGIGTADNIGSSVDILTLMMLQNGAKMTSDDHTTALFHTAQNVLPEFANQNFPGAKALEFYSSFADPKNANYTWNSTEPDAVRAFAEGKTAMLIDYARQAKEIKRISPDLQYATASVPQAAETAHLIDLASYVSYGVNHNSTNANLAWDFVLSMTNAENADLYKEQTGKPAARLEKIPEDSAILIAQSWFKPEPQKADDAFKEMIKQANAGQTAQTAIEGAAAKITSLLGALK